jgi:Flp pilus assembly protein TadG
MFFRLLRHFRLRRRGQEGVAAVEFALCLIPLLLVIAGIIDFGDAFFTKQVVTNASRAGVRYGIRWVTNPTDPSGQRLAPNTSAIQQLVKSNYGNDLTVTVGGTGLTSNKSGDPLSVTVTKVKTWIFLDFLSDYVSNLPAQLSNTTTMTLE